MNQLGTKLNPLIANMRSLVGSKNKDILLSLFILFFSLLIDLYWFFFQEPLDRGDFSDFGMMDDDFSIVIASMDFLE